MLTIIYGNDLWVVINNFMNGLTGQKRNTNYSLAIGTVYVGIHLLTGFVIGTWTARLPRLISKWSGDEKLILEQQPIELPAFAKLKKRKKLKLLLFVVWLLLIALYVQSYFNIGRPVLPAHLALKIFLRSLIIVLGWVFLINPTLKYLLNRWLHKKQTTSAAEIKNIIELIPSVQAIMLNSWRETGDRKGFSRLDLFSKMVLVNLFRSSDYPIDRESKPEVFLLTGPIRSGKTSSLLKWIEGRTDVSGILTPLVDGKRVFMNIETKEIFPMEASSDETKKLVIGKYEFSKKNFNKAIEIVQSAISNKGWLIVDEIGPLELKGEGFHDVLKKLLSEYRGNLLLVIRDNLVDEVVRYFKIENLRNPLTL